ncbi:alpha/beta hydrolase [Desulfosarcina widdelii]|nr:alpha/beta hydrolase [Desulfosarcina widdelii]
MAAEWIIPANPTEGKVLLYIHGGGFISGSCRTHRAIVAKFALGCRLKALVFDYRLAPEHPFPAGLDDCVAAYRWLLEEGYRSDDIVVGGESAGGTLTLSLLLALKEKKIPLPKAAFSISPVTDLRCQAASFEYNAKNDIAPINASAVWTSYYVGRNDPVSPLLSPLMGDYKGLPPLHICVGTHEIHYDDCADVAAKAKAHGVDVTFSQWLKMVHAFPVLSPLFPEAKMAMREICGFVKKQLNIQ